MTIETTSNSRVSVGLCLASLATFATMSGCFFPPDDTGLGSGGAGAGTTAIGVGGASTGGGSEMGGSDPGGSDPGTVVCEAQIQAAIEASGQGLFVGGFQEAAASEDPTGGLIIAAVPSGDGPFRGQMINTYLDCQGNIGTGGTYDGQRSGEELMGSWTMRQLEGEFGGSWNGAVTVDNTEVSGSYDVTGGPSNSVCASGHGVPDCYCSSAGAFQLRDLADGNSRSDKNTPFTVTSGASGVVFDTMDNPNTVDDESEGAQTYAIIALDKVCSDETPLVGYCPNFGAEDPLTVEYTESCAVSFPMTLADQAKVLTCPCVYLEEMIEGDWYVAVGIDGGVGAGGLMFDDVDATSMKLFQY